MMIDRRPMWEREVDAKIQALENENFKLKEELKKLDEYVNQLAFSPGV